jgi:hypothetical protein
MTWVTPAGWDCAYQLVRGYPSPQDADVAVIERPLGPEGDLDRLFAVGGHGSATLGILGEVDDPEPNLRLDRPGAGSQSVTDGEPYGTRTPTAPPSRLHCLHWICIRQRILTV